jgi:cytochrome c oxidase subunit 3/cytochrome o ubiquinol oxidase subunit 3
VSEPTTLPAAAPGAALPQPPPVRPEKTLAPQQWGVLAFLLSEVAFFSTLVIAYIVFMGQDVVGPTPGEALSLKLAILSSVFLLSSSGTIHLAEGALRRGHPAVFRGWWALTITLGVAFLAATAHEWRELIYTHGLTIGRNLFGTTYYTLVGFHALHVTLGVLAMAIVLGLALRGAVSEKNALGAELTAWYWHFVDGVWIVVFTVVYVISRSACDGRPVAGAPG